MLSGLFSPAPLIPPLMTVAKPNTEAWSEFNEKDGYIC